MSARPTRSSIWINRAWQARAKILGALWIAALAIPTWRVAWCFQHPRSTAVLFGRTYQTAVYVDGTRLVVISRGGRVVDLISGSTVKHFDRGDGPHMARISGELRGWPNPAPAWLQTRFVSHVSLPLLTSHTWTSQERRRLVEELARYATPGMPDDRYLVRSSALLARADTATITEFQRHALPRWVAYAFEPLGARAAPFLATLGTLLVLWLQHTRDGRARVREWHVRHALCPRCGYNQDYSQIRCPECGWAK